MEYKIETGGHMIKDISSKDARETTPEILKFWNGAYNEGFEDGKVKGLEMAKDKVEDIKTNLEFEATKVKEKLELMIDSFLKEKEKLIKSSETSIFELVKEIARRIIKIEINANSKKIVTEAVNQVLKRVREEERVIIKINPADFQTIKSKEEEWLNSLPSVSKFQIIADESISQGGCLIETTSGKVDATIESKLKKLEDL